MCKSMKALVLTEDRTLVMREAPVPAPGPDEILIKTGAALICTSDINDIRGNSFGIRLPMILGHEGAGTVAEIGADVTGFNIGDAVAAHPVVPCYACDSCRRGLPHLCDDMGHLGIDRGGTFAGYFALRADRVRRIPKGMAFTTAALMEPVCVCLEAIERARVPAGGTVLVAGDGPFGVIIANLCAAIKDIKVILLGRHEFRMGYAGDAIKIMDGPDALQSVIEASGGGVDSAIMCAGTNSALDICVAALKSRGTLSVFSAIHGTAKVDMLRVHIKELNICGSCNDMDFPDDAVERLASGDLGRIVTHRFPLDGYAAAFDIAANGKDNALKVAFTEF